MRTALTAMLLIATCPATALCPSLNAIAMDDTFQDSRQVVEGTVNASVDEVWAAWTTKEILETWMAPMVEVDFKIGGTYQTNYNPQGKIGDSGTIVNEIMSFDFKRMLSFRVAQAPAGFPFPNAIANVWTIVYLEEVSSEVTTVTVVMLGYDDTDESKKMRQFFAAGNSHTLKALKAALEK